MKKFNLKKSIWNDYILMITLIFPLTLCGFLIYFFATKEESQLVIYIFAVYIGRFHRYVGQFHRYNTEGKTERFNLEA